MIKQLTIGATYSNAEVAEAFGVSTQGGMRKSNANNCLVLISKESANLYPDKWDGEVLNYSGMGQQGDQRLDYSQNRALAQSRDTDLTVYLMINKEPNRYVNYGEVELVQDPYMMFDGHRNVAIFPIQPLEKKAKD